MDILWTALFYGQSLFYGQRSPSPSLWGGGGGAGFYPLHFFTAFHVLFGVYISVSIIGYRSQLQIIWFD